MSIDRARAGLPVHVQEHAAGLAAIVLGASPVLAACGSTTRVILVTPGTGDATPLVAPLDVLPAPQPMLIPRFGHTATRLKDGRVLIAGGLRATGADEADPGASADGGSGDATSPGGRVNAEIFDPKTGAFVRAGKMTTPRWQHVAVSLKDGRVLLLGGEVPTETADVYDPLTGTFTGRGYTTLPRARATATVLRDGSVLVVGGDQGALEDCGTVQPGLPTRSARPAPSGVPFAPADVYQPVTGLFHATGGIASGLTGHLSVPLTDGRVLVVGGRDACWDPHGADVYDPAAGAFTPTGAPFGTLDEPQAAVLHDGSVLVIGGDRDGTLAQLFDPFDGEFRMTGSLNHARSAFAVAPLPDGRVLVAGGSDPQGGPVLEIEAYDPGTGTFSDVGRLSSGRTDATATVLRDGHVLLAGGMAGDGAAVAATDLYPAPEVAGAPQPSPDTDTPSGEPAASAAGSALPGATEPPAAGAGAEPRATPSPAPAGTAAAPADLAACTVPEPYTVRKGETVASIATDHGLTVALVLAANPSIDVVEGVKAGDRIVLPGPIARVEHDTSSEGSGYVIGDDGAVVGVSAPDLSTGARGYTWRDGAVTDLPPLGSDPVSLPFAIGAGGDVVGASLEDLEAGSSRAVLWHDGTPVDLGDLGGASAFAVGIDGTGAVAGTSETADGAFRGFLWKSGKLTALGTLAGDSSKDAESIATASDVKGDVVGVSDTRRGAVHAFLWRKGKMTDLGSLAGPDGLSFATAVNDRGQVVGRSETQSGKIHAFLWQDGKMTDLGTLPGDSMSVANGINACGQVVGASISTRMGWVAHPVVWPTVVH